jgi:hypothetical protein
MSLDYPQAIANREGRGQIENEKEKDKSRIKASRICIIYI